MVVALRRDRAGVDLLAVVSLVGTLAVGDYLAGSLVAVMVATGRTVDAVAERRASRDLRALLERAPRSARRRRGDTVETVSLDEVTAGDLVIVGPGEVVPVDGRVAAGRATLDESALTGESVLVDRTPDPVRRNWGPPGSAPARRSQHEVGRLAAELLDVAGGGLQEAVAQL